MCDPSRFQNRASPPGTTTRTRPISVIIPVDAGLRRLSVSLVAFQEIGARVAARAGQMEARRGREAVEAEQGRRGRPVCANRRRCTEPGDSVDQPRLKERRRHTAATLDQEPVMPRRAEGGENCRSHGPTVGSGSDLQNHCSSVSAAREFGIRRGWSRYHPESNRLCLSIKLCHRRNAQVRVYDTRTGDRCSRPGRRQVSCGSSASAVPAPISTASCVARSQCPRRRAASSVIQRLSPEASAMRPSRLVASFNVTIGRPCRSR